MTAKPAGQPGACSATMLHALHGRKQCGEPAGHYDEARKPEGGVDATEPAGWHHSAPPDRWEPNGRRFIWSDQSDAATPHDRHEKRNTMDRDTRARAITELLGAAESTTEANALTRVGLRAGFLWRCPTCKEPNYADRDACCGNSRPAGDPDD